MRQSSSSPSSSSIPPTSSVSFFERYEKMFNGCGGCIADDEHEPVASAIIYQQSSDERDEQQQSTQPNEAISNYWSSSNNQARRRHHQESAPPVETTVLLNQASFDESDKFDIEERTSKRQQSKTTQAAKVKAQTEATAVNEYFNGIRNSHQPEIQMAIQISPTTIMTQQQQRRQQQQHCHSIPIKSNTNVIPFSPKTSKQPSVPPKTRLQQYDMFQVVMPRSFRSVQGSTGPQHRHEGNLKYIDSDSTQSTQSMSESEDDLSWGSEDEEQQLPPQQEQLVSILRRKVKLGMDTDTKKTDTNNRGRVRFEQDTKFPDPNERPSSTRKQVPRMSPRQKQVYMLMHTYYPPTTIDRRQRQRTRQLDVSSLLMAAAAGPSPLVRAPHTNHDEFCDPAMTATKKNSPTNMNMRCSSSTHQERLARRAQQNQYHHHHHQRSHSSTTEEILLSDYYTRNNQ
eukprot:CAMPEP_0170848524 /NCGR_PEP_ID=MMETSP0734-20130129/9431_1 /TAXON_ID=186038 /ORGANISM="Fragilariopsis kerguelensis, Strain L26-C5" /LENGTH=454 /DNA_ID=CAMNT_0011217953 /DNA_START=115 /DNA_END=1479 /DNA_ORIENTATION=+